MKGLNFNFRVPNIFLVNHGCILYYSVISLRSFHAHIKSRSWGLVQNWWHCAACSSLIADWRVENDREKKIARAGESDFRALFIMFTFSFTRSSRVHNYKLVSHEMWPSKTMQKSGTLKMPKLSVTVHNSLKIHKGRTPSKTSTA